MSPRISSSIAALTLVAAIALPVVWIFGPAFSSERSFAYRDAAHFYYPLFDWAHRQWSLGQPPLWNPHESLGQPHVAVGVSSLFYPGKLIFAAPIPYTAAYNLYIIGHVVLAAGAAWLAARKLGAGAIAAGAAAVAYAFGGSVVFQYCNVVFLVGAAWLPLSLWAAHEMLTRRSFLWAAALGGALAMMTLGGDPQSAYHAMLIAALGAVVYAGSDRRDESSDARTRASRSLLSTARRHRLTLLAVAAMVGASLSAVQILPTFKWSLRSSRAEFTSPRSLYELPTAWSRTDSTEEFLDAAQRGLLGPVQRRSHHEHIYRYSVPPWRCAELLWPNVTGRTFPENQRWTRAIPSGGEVWTPSIYLGLLPLLAALSGWTLFTGDKRDRWLCWTAMLAFLAALGWYGGGWLLHEIRCGLFGADPDSPLIGKPVGGLYWLMAVGLPGYVGFRFPAKLLVPAALAVCLLAARAWNRSTADRSRWMKRALAVVTSISLLLLALAFACRPWWISWVESAPPDALFGPLEVGGAFWDLVGGLAHGAVVGGAAWTLLSFAGRWQGLSASLLLLTAVEIAAAHGWMAPVADASIWQAPPALADDVSAPERGFRVFRGLQQRWKPAEWRRRPSPRRLYEGLAWDHDTLFPKHHLLAGLSLAEVHGTLNPLDVQAFYYVARRYGFRRHDNIIEPNPNILAALGVRDVILPAGSAVPGASPVIVDDDRYRPLVSLWRLSPNPGRAWIVHDVEILPPLATTDPREVVRRTEQVLFPDNRRRDLSRTAVIETEMDVASVLSTADQIAGGEDCQIVVDLPSRIEIETTLKSPGVVVLADLFDEDWIATLQTSNAQKPLPIHRANRVMRAVVLPAGRHRIVYRYRPGWLYAGAWISGLSWMTIALGFTFCRCRASGMPMRRNRTEHEPRSAS